MAVSVTEQQKATQKAQEQESIYFSTRNDVAGINHARAETANKNNADYHKVMNSARGHGLSAFEAEKAEEVAGKIYELALDLVEVQALAYCLSCYIMITLTAYY